MKPLMPEITVNGVTLSAASIAAEAQNHPAPQGKPGLAWQRAARALVIQHLLTEAAQGVDAVPQQIAPGQTETLPEARIRALMDREIRPAPVDEERLRQTYDAHPDQFRAPALYEASHILWAVDPAKDGALAAAMDHAQKTCDRLQSTPKAFGDTAKRESACSSRENGGFLGQLSAGDTVPEFEAAMAALDEGQISAPVQTRFGVHLIRLDAKAAGDVLPYDAVRDRLYEAAEMAAWTQAAQAFTADLVNRAEITGIDLTKVA